MLGICQHHPRIETSRGMALSVIASWHWRVGKCNLGVPPFAAQPITKMKILACSSEWPVWSKAEAECPQWEQRPGRRDLAGYCGTPLAGSEARNLRDGFPAPNLAGFVCTRFSVSRDEQRHRFKERKVHPLKQWKLSPIDLASLDSRRAPSSAARR